MNKSCSHLFLLFGFLLFLLLGGGLHGGGLGFLLELLQSVHGGLGSSGDTGGELEGSSGEGDFATFAFPDSAGDSPDSGLSARRAEILGVLLDLELLHNFPDGSAVTGSILSGDSHLLGSFGHFGIVVINIIKINKIKR